VTAWRVRLTGPGEPRPVLIEGDPASTRGAFVEALRAVGHERDRVFVDGARWTTADTDPIYCGDPGHTGAACLRNGALISERATPPAEVAPGTYLVAVGGPGSGRAVRLDVGRPVVVGRSAPGAAADPSVLTIDDPLLSARHFEAELGAEGMVQVRDLGSRNGTVYEGETVDRAALTPGGRLHAGASLFAAVELTAGDRATLLGTTPTGLNIHRQFREAEADLPTPPDPPKPPHHPSGGGGGAWWRALTPLAGAVGMAAFTGRWEFLLIAALAPIVFTVDAHRRKRQTRREHASEQAAYAEARQRYQTELARCRSTEVRRARQRYPGGGAAALFARYRHRRVWERRPADTDFAAVTLGYAALPSRYATKHDQAGLGKAGPTGADLWQAPLTIDLTEEGPLGITGPLARATAAARALIVDLAFTHAPVEVNLWVFTDDLREAEWAFVAWLPHAFTPGGGARLAATPTGRSTLMQALRGLIDARREQRTTRDTGPVLPLQVVVIDGVDSLAAPDLAEILRHGPDVGVIGIVTDPAIVPEGIRGEVRLGRFDDECTYRSVATPRVDGVTVSQLSAALALDAALALAPLEAFGSSGNSGPIAQLYFTELVGFGARAAVEQAEFWKQHSPRTSVPVGVTIDGAPFTIDFVRHGPHGLIGGMTRSGKTEFLKTWFSSLAMYNHPDDLAIAIVDFKGGIDHKTTATLPHVIAVATNQNIDLFERTITLLTAELARRERIFHEAGVATIEGYRTARERRPALAPIPRLMVVVDEFAELLETPEGKSQIGRLESITRIGAGLGVHLLLLTQMFNYTLPPTIDGQAGLRICFKVQNGENSKIVLRSAAAAGISSATKGRGFARFQGGDLIEFQAARIGNEARHRVTAGSGNRLAAHFVTLDSLTRPPAPPEQREVPNEEQDLFHVVEVLRAAARLAGCPGGVVPWPAELPFALDLAELTAMVGAGAGSLAIGLADDPEHQRVLPLVHSFGDPVVAYAGASGSGHHEALVTTATRLVLSTSPDDLHIYGIDLIGQGLGLLAGLPHVGTVATRDDATALRIVTWLITEAARRRSVIARAGASDYTGYVQNGGSELPRIVLFVLGADRMFLHGEGSISPLLAPTTTLVNEVGGTGAQVVFSGSYPVLANRLGTTASRRLVFGANDPAEYPATIPRAARAQLGVPHRCFDSATGLLAQVARVVPDDVNPGEVYAALGDGVAAALGHAPRRPPRTFTKAPWPLQLGDIGAGELATPAPGIESPLPLGVRPDTGEILWIDPLEDGLAFRIVGPPKSGRSNALAAIATLAARCGWDVIAATASRRSPIGDAPALAGRVVPVDAIVELVAGGVVRPTVVVVDDAHRIDDDFPWKKLTTVERGPVVTIVAGSTEALTRPIGVMKALNAANGVSLMPARSRDADGVGVRMLDDDWLVQPLAGVGVAGIAGEAHRLQFPLVL